MTRKMTKFSRKRMHTDGTYIRNSFIAPILHSRPYTDEPIIGMQVGATQSAADKSIKTVRDAFDALKAGATPPDNERNFDLVSYALDIACIRAGQILGPEPADNIMLPPLIAANVAMRAVLARRKKWRKWEMLAAEIEAVDYALEIYHTIVMASSPAQMSEAVDLRMKALRGQTLETLEIEHA